MNTITQTETRIRDRSARKAPGHVVTSAWAIPVMVLTGWAFFASIPVAALTVATWRDARVRALRWWASLTAALYAIPFTGYLMRTDAEASMSDLLHPGMGLAIAASAAVVIVKLFKSHRG